MDLSVSSCSLNFLRMRILKSLLEKSQNSVFGFNYWKIIVIFWWCHVFLILDVPWVLFASFAFEVTITSSSLYQLPSGSGYFSLIFYLGFLQPCMDAPAHLLHASCSLLWKKFFFNECFKNLLSATFKYALLSY